MNNGARTCYTSHLGGFSALETVESPTKDIPGKAETGPTLPMLEDESSTLNPKNNDATVPNNNQVLEEPQTNTKGNNANVPLNDDGVLRE